ncbi:MAG TPA: hypothetical protein VLL07_05010 [Pontiella sp.]|nr:hypothetical protein [Pontiella sp.]
MYNISRQNGYLMVKFIDDIDFPMILAAIHHETMLGDYADTNDIWLIGKSRVAIQLGEIEILASEFQCRCPRDATRAKTAIVVDAGLTGSIVELWVNSIQRKVPFEIEIFRTLDEAKSWVGSGDTTMLKESICS